MADKPLSGAAFARKIARITGKKVKFTVTGGGATQVTRGTVSKSGRVSQTTTPISGSNGSSIVQKQSQQSRVIQTPVMIKAEPRFTQAQVAQVRVQQRNIVSVTPTEEEKITKKKFAQRFGARVFDIFSSPFKGAAKITSKETRQAQVKTIKGVGAVLSIQRAIRAAKKKGISQKEAKKIKKAFDKNLATLRRVDPTVAAKLRKDPNVKAFGLVTGLAATSLVPVARPVIAGAFKALTVVQAGKTAIKPTPENVADLAVLAGTGKAAKLLKAGGRALSPSTTKSLLASKAGRARIRTGTFTKKTRSAKGTTVTRLFKPRKGQKAVVVASEFTPKGQSITPRIRQRLRTLESGTTFKEGFIRIAKGKKVRVSQAAIGKEVVRADNKILGRGVFVGKGKDQFFSIESKSSIGKLSNQFQNIIKKQTKAGVSGQELKTVKSFQKLLNKQAKGTIKTPERKQLLTLSKNQAVQSVFRKLTPSKATAPTTARIGERGVQTQGRERVVAQIKAKIKIQARELRRLRLKKPTRAARRTELKADIDKLGSRLVDRKLSLVKAQRSLTAAKKLRVTRRVLLQKGTGRQGLSQSDKRLAQKLLDRSIAKIGTAPKSSSTTLSLTAKQLDLLKSSALFGQIKSLPGFDVTVKPGNKLAISSKVAGVQAFDIKQDIIQKIIPKVAVPSKPKIKPPSTSPKRKVPTKIIPPKKKPVGKIVKKPKAIKPPKKPVRAVRKGRKAPKLPKIPRIPTLPKANKTPRKKSSRRFVGLVKEKGRLLATTRVGLTKNRALNDAAFIADNSAAASISIKRSKSGIKIKDTSISSRFRKFRRSKKPGSKLLVERRKHRIDSAGEKRGITAKGLIARRLKAKMKLKRRIIKKTTGAKRRILKRKPAAKKVSRMKSILRGRRKSKRK